MAMSERAVERSWTEAEEQHEGAEAGEAGGFLPGPALDDYIGQDGLESPARALQERLHQGLGLGVAEAEEARRYSRPVRMAILFGGSGLLWWAIVQTAFAMLD